MNKEILLVADAVSNEKALPKRLSLRQWKLPWQPQPRNAMEVMSISASVIDRQTGNYETFRRWEVIDDSETELLEFPERQITLSAARIDNPEIQPGEFIEEETESASFGRIAAQTAKQVIVQKVREAERAQVVEAYQRKDRRADQRRGQTGGSGQRDPRSGRQHRGADSA
jgi:transcription termination/antitermination protein NusA